MGRNMINNCVNADEVGISPGKFRHDVGIEFQA